nr:hypothetical protein [uncultured Albidiferax sp.]
MNTTDKKASKPLTPAELQERHAEAERVALQIIDAAATEPHARVIAALFMTLGAITESHPCCRASVAKLCMQYGLRFASVPETSLSHHVH